MGNNGDARSVGYPTYPSTRNVLNHPFSLKPYPSTIASNSSTSIITTPSPGTATTLPPPPVEPISMTTNRVHLRTRPQHPDDESLLPSTSVSITPLRRSPRSSKRSSSQVISGINRGLNRFGSVLRRKVPDEVNADRIPAEPVTEVVVVSASEGFSRQSLQPTKVPPLPDGENHVADEGDPEVGRPLNVEHDLHVSSDLADLPASWLSTLKAQGLTDSDLALISAGRRRQQRNVSPTFYSMTKKSEPPSGLHKPMSRTASMTAKTDHLERARGVSTPASSGYVSAFFRSKRSMPASTSSSTGRSICASRAEQPRNWGARGFADPLRCFSQLPVVHHDDGWADALLSTMAEDHPTQDPNEKFTREEMIVPTTNLDRALPECSHRRLRADLNRTISQPVSRRPSFLPHRRAPLAPSSLISTSHPSHRNSTHSFLSGIASSVSSSDSNLVTPAKTLTLQMATKHNDSAVLKSLLPIPVSETSSSGCKGSRIPHGSFGPIYLDPTPRTSSVSPDLLLPLRTGAQPLGTRIKYLSFPATASVASDQASRTTSAASIYADPDPETEPDLDPLSRLDRAGRDERASIALSLISSESGLNTSITEATVQQAYLKFLRMSSVQELEVGQGVSGDEEEGRSAILALDEAARLIAGEKGAAAPSQARWSS